MKNSYLATGFANVDSCDDAAIFVSCLNFLASLPYFQWYKAETYRHLNLQPGLSVLDVGCGLGDDACRISELVSPGGQVTGVDASLSMVTQAQNRTQQLSEKLTFEVADARRLQFQTGCFDRCRIDRVLQHIADPETAIKELYRVLKPGGLAVGYDNDWGSFSLSSEDLPITRKVQDRWCYSFTNPWIGRHLSVFFRRAGFEDIAIYPSVSLISDFETADKVYNIRKTIERLLSLSQITPKEADKWIDELSRQTSDGTFRAALTAYLIVGRKPE